MFYFTDISRHCPCSLPLLLSALILALTHGLRLSPGLRQSPALLGSRSSDSSCYTRLVLNSGMLILLSTLSTAPSCSCSTPSPSTLNKFITQS